jgi:hypothetical protein
MIALSVISFIASSASFCVAIGANFTDEGWGDNKRGLGEADKSLLGVSAILMVIAIVIFWIGMHRLSKPPVNKTTP